MATTFIMTAKCEKALHLAITFIPSTQWLYYVIYICKIRFSRDFVFLFFENFILLSVRRVKRPKNDQNDGNLSLRVMTSQ